MNILIVDDDSAKVRRIIEVLKRVAGIDLENISLASNALDAKKLLLKVDFDLLILDIALPERADQGPAVDGGVELLQEISERAIYKKPREIVGLTAFPEAFESANPRFTKDLWHVIQYDSSAKAWEGQLERKARYIQLVLTNQPRAEYDFDLCVITALPIPEFRALMDLPWNWGPLDLQGEIGEFKAGSFEAAGRKRKVVATYSSRPGMANSAILATRAIYNFRPRYLAMTGIAAGFKDECALGDILVADPTWDYGSGKWYMQGSKTKFDAAPHQIGLNAALRSRLQGMARETKLLDDIRNGWRGPTPKTALRMAIGPLASGAAVRADPKIAEEIRVQHRKTLGLEMEAYGVMAAAHEAPLPEVKAFVLKSVSDFADGDKADDMQPYASYTSAMALKIFVEKFLTF